MGGILTSLALNMVVVPVLFLKYETGDDLAIDPSAVVPTQ